MTPSFNDSRDLTLAERLKIGFEEKKEWKDKPAEFTNDTLTISGHPVMERWEEPYMKELARIATSRGGRVLEVGFGMGISAGYIQDHYVNEHVIIEANKDVAKKARIFALEAKYPTQIIEHFWEDATKLLASESFDGILFDTYPLCAEEIHKNHFFFFQEAFRLLKPGGVLTYYSDEIDRFSPEHERTLRDAGFHKIDGFVCPVNTPDNCKYWKAKTFLAPIIQKQPSTSPETALHHTNTKRDYGLHITIDAYGANSKKLEDVQLMFETLNTLPTLIGMRKIGFPQMAQFTEKEIAGISGLIMVVESHISLHTYSKKDFFSMDVYSCKPFDYHLVVDYMKKIYEFKELELNVIVRGKQFPVENLHD